MIHLQTAEDEEPTTFLVSELIDLPPWLRFLEFEVLGSSLLNWLVAALVLTLAYPLLRFLVAFVAGRLESLSARTPGRVDELAASLLRETKGAVLFVVALWIASLTLSPSWAERMWLLVQLAVLVQLAIWASRGVTWLLERYRSRQLDDDPGVATAVGAMGFLGRVAVWAIVLLTALATMGVEIGPALAGLGVGGIAIALAVQNILGDLFASLSIIFDRPFVIGDFIIVGDLLGTVEHVGLKTTRVRALSGEQLVFSNSDLLNSRVRNFKRMEQRRILFRFGVQYDTGYERLRKIPGIVEEIINGVDKTRFDRAHFADFADSALEFEVVYFMLVPDFNSYMDAQQAINLELYRRLEELGVSFAFPTRTLHLHMEKPEEIALALGQSESAREEGGEGERKEGTG